MSYGGKNTAASRLSLSPLRPSADSTPPEQLICQYANVWGDDRYNREREHGRYIDYMAGINAAVAGLVLKDRALLRLAARYALCHRGLRAMGRGHDLRFPRRHFQPTLFRAVALLFQCRAGA